MKIWVPSSIEIVETNKQICKQYGNPHAVLNGDRIESALSSALYPGSPPFEHGGVVSIAGALAFYLIKGHAFQDGNKRTALAVSLAFLDVNGWELQYPFDEEKDVNAIADLAEECAAGKKSKEDMMKWFDTHKVEKDTPERKLLKSIFGETKKKRS